MASQWAALIESSKYLKSAFTHSHVYDRRFLYNLLIKNSYRHSNQPNSHREQFEAQAVFGIVYTLTAYYILKLFILHTAYTTNEQYADHLHCSIQPSIPECFQARK